VNSRNHILCSAVVAFLKQTVLRKNRIIMTTDSVGIRASDEVVLKILKLPTVFFVHVVTLVFICMCRSYAGYKRLT